jgi:tape measure domain-containing protein
MSDYVLNVEINSSAAVTGAQAFDRAVDGMAAKVRAFKAEVATLYATFGTSTSNLSASVERLASSLTKLLPATIQALGASANATRATINDLATSFERLGRTNLSTLMNELRAATLAAERLQAELGKPRPGQPNRPNGQQPQPDASSSPSALSAADAAALASATGNFGNKAANVATQIEQMAAAMGAAGNAFKTFSAGANGIANDFKTISTQAGELTGPLNLMAGAMAKLSLATASLRSGFEPLARVASLSNGLEANVPGTTAFAKALDTLALSSKGFQSGNFNKEFSNLKFALADSKSIDAATISIEKLVRAADAMRGKAFDTFQKLSADIFAASAALGSFKRLLDTIDPRGIERLSGAFAIASSDAKSLKNDLLALPTAMREIGTGGRAIQSALAGLDLSKFTASIAQSLPTIKGLAAEVRTLASGFTGMEVAFTNIAALANNISGQVARAASDAQRLANAARDARDAARPRQGERAQTTGRLGNLQADALAAGFTFAQFAGLGLINTMTRLVSSVTQTGDRIVNLRGAFAQLGLAGIAAAGSLASFAGGGILAGLRGLGSVLGGLANQFVRMSGLMLAFSTIRLFTSLPGNVAEAGDAFVQLQNKIAAFTSSSAEASELFKRIAATAQNTRTSITDVGATFVRFYGELQPLGNSMQTVENVVNGISIGLKRAGATAEETKRAFTQLGQALSKGQFDLQDLKSLKETAPALLRTIEKDLGITIAKFHELQVAGGKAAEGLQAKFFTAIANYGIKLKDQMASIPRTIAEAFTQLSNTWLLTIGQIQNDTGFMERLTASIDRVRDVLGGAAMRGALTNLIDGAATALDYISKWALTGDTFAVVIDKLHTKIVNLGSVIRAAALDVLTLGFAGSSSANFDRIDKETADRKRGYGASPFGQAYDPNASAKARTSAGLDSIANDFKSMPAIPLKFSTEAAKTQAVDLVQQVGEQMRELSRQSHMAVENGIGKVTSEEARKIDIITEKLAIIQRQFNSGTISSEAAASAQAVIAEASAMADQIKGKLSTAFDNVKDTFTPQFGFVDGKLTDIGTQAETARAKTELLSTSVKNLVAILASFNGANFNFSANIVSNIPNAVTEAAPVKVPAPVKEKKAGGGANQGLDKINSLRAELEVKRAELLLDEDAIRAAKTNLEIQKAVKEAIKQGHPERAKVIADLIREKSELDKQLEWAKEFKGLGQSIGNTIADAFLSAGKSGEKFGVTMKKVMASVLEQITKTLLIKPLVDNMSNALGQIGGQLGKASGGNASQGLFGLLGMDLSAKGVSGVTDAATWTSAVTASGVTFETATATAGTTISTSVVAAATEFGVGITSGVTTAMTELTTFMTTAASEFSALVTTAGVEVAASLQAASFAGGGGGAGGGISAGISSLFAANGHAFAAGSSGPVTMFANGGVFDQATPFTYGGGKLGVMGEGGQAEAVMPLKRGPDGKLGVRAGGQSNAQPNVTNITFNIAGDLTEETRARIAADMDQLISRRTPGIVDRSVSTVVRKNRDSSAMLRR